jgi:hypothetical protein
MGLHPTGRNSLSGQFVYRIGRVTAETGAGGLTDYLDSLYDLVRDSVAMFEGKGLELLYPHVTELVRAGSSQPVAQPRRAAREVTAWPPPSAPVTVIVPDAASPLRARATASIHHAGPLGELVLSGQIEPTPAGCLWHAWDEAQIDAELAYEAWVRTGGREAEVVYRAAQDRADAAQDALADCQLSRSASN